MRTIALRNELQRTGSFMARFGTAAGFITVANWTFDYPFTGWAVWQFGSVIGSALVICVALIANYFIILWYRRTTADWFGMEWLRTQEAVNSDHWTGRLVRTCLRKSRLLAFATISTFLDPTYAFIYQRGRLTGTRFTRNDWWWFATANVLGILPWVIGASLIVETAKRTLI